MLTKVQSYKKLVLYQKAKELVLVVYRITAKFPRTEIYTLVPQIRRAALSILANIVEGYAKESSAEYVRFLTISIGSLTELEVFLDISSGLGFIDAQSLEKTAVLLLEVKRLLYGTRKKIRERRGGL